jgi:hypothetical protein
MKGVKKVGEGRWRETIGSGFGTGRHKGTTKTTEVLHEGTGKVGGAQVEHWDGSMDAQVKPETVKYSMFQKEGT